MSAGDVSARGYTCANKGKEVQHGGVRDSDGARVGLRSRREWQEAQEAGGGGERRSARDAQCRDRQHAGEGWGTT